MAQTTIGGATVTVEDTAQSDREGRPVFEWTIELADGEFYSAQDLCGPVMGPEPDEQEMLKTLCVFLGAAAESYGYEQRSGRNSDNRDLFPESVTQWAYQNEDEIDLLGMESE